MAKLAIAHPQLSSPASPAGLGTAAVASAMRTDPGRVRGENQDTCAAALEHGIFVVCDGMGGAAAGELASQLATEAFIANIRGSAAPADNGRRNPSSDPTIIGPDHPQKRLEQAVRAANLAVFQRAQKSRALHGMGTTLVAALIQPDGAAHSAWIAHVGDSRCYLLRDGRFEQLTTDHSVVEEQIQAGFITREQAELSPVRNVITRAVGTQPSVPADIREQPLRSGDILLLASDGLSRELDDNAIAHFIAQNGTNLEAACEALIQAANEHGGRDNITVLLIRLDYPCHAADCVHS
ncbi:MAG TPA: Stp1/IreP family PP2C-type Ser/Thr phosphatase [Acidobacteriaceae bacterium]|nr:Stp1/IreP family PP2C-type Ser/Thr phosphatase [Acidobacteriaceae bacterium]